MTYTLDSSGSLELEMSVENLSSVEVPVGIGWHPYFTLGQCVDDLHLRIPPSKQVLVDERLLPTGSFVDMQAFATPTKIAGTAFDTCFQFYGDTDALGGRQEVVLWSEPKRHGVAVWQNCGPGQFNYSQICITPDRMSIAIEPVSCGINAFNTQEGIVLLKPQASFSACCGVRWLERIS
jgi:aldose 1-epimerase